MADLKKFLFDVDFDDVELMETIVQEEVEEKKGDSEAEEPEPELIVPMFSEEDLEAAQQEGFNKGKENGSAETLADIENSMSEVLSLIVDKISELFDQQLEFNEQITNESISLIKNVNRKLFPVMNKQGALDEAVEFSQVLLSKLLTEPSITIRVHESIAEPLKQRVQQFLNGGSYRGDLLVSGDEDITVGSCQIEWSSGSAERDPEMLLSEIEERMLSAVDNAMSAKTSKQAASSIEKSQTETGSTVSDAEMQTVGRSVSANDIDKSGETLGDAPSISDSNDEENSEVKLSNPIDENDLDASSSADPLQVETDATVSEAENSTIGQDGSVNSIIEAGEFSDDTPPASDVDDGEKPADKTSNLNYENGFEASSSAEPLQTQEDDPELEAEKQIVGQNGAVNDTTKSREDAGDIPPISDVDEEEGTEEQ